MPRFGLVSLRCIRIRFPDEGLVLPKAVRHTPGSRVDGTTRGPEDYDGEPCYVGTFEAVGFPPTEWQRLQTVLETTYRPLQVLEEDAEAERYVARMYMPVKGLHGRAAQMLYPLMDAFDGIWWHYEGWDSFLAGRVKDDADEAAIVEAIRARLEGGGLSAEFEACDVSPEEAARIEALRHL